MDSNKLLLQAKVQEILWNTYLLGEQEKEVHVKEVVETIKQQLIGVIDLTKKEEKVT